jgi:hypothetical protein
MTGPPRNCSVNWTARRLVVKERARAQLGVEVDKPARQSILRRARKGDIRYARKLTHSRTVMVVEYEGRELAFLYSTASQEIIGFLSPDAPEIAEWLERRAAPAKPVRSLSFRGAHR